MIDDKDLTKFQEVISKVQELSASLSENFQDDDFEDTAGSILANYYSLFNRFCPYQIDDTVVLIKDATQDYFAETQKHLLVEGAIAVVKGRGYRGDKFAFQLEFDRTRIDGDGKIVQIILPVPVAPPQPVTMAPYPPEMLKKVMNTHTFGEDWIRALES